MIAKPAQSQFAEYQLHYASLVHGDPMELLQDQADTLNDLVSNATDEQLDYAYAEGKWTLKQSLMHLLDAERIFAYRALSISRGDTQVLTGYDHNQYVDDNSVDHISKEQLLVQINVVRAATIVLYDVMTTEQLSRVSQVSDYHNSAAAILYVIAGHCEHHIKLFKEKYNC